MQTAQETAMSPDVHERIAVAESKIELTRSDVAKILTLVEKMPTRLTKRMKRLLQECRSGQEKTYGLRKTEAAPVAPDRDWGQVLRNIVIVASIVGGLVGGAYQATQVSDRPAAIQSQGGGK